MNIETKTGSEQAMTTRQFENYRRDTPEAMRAVVISWGRDPATLYLSELRYAREYFERNGKTSKRCLELDPVAKDRTAWFVYGVVEHALEAFDRDPSEGMLLLVDAYRELERE